TVEAYDLSTHGRRWRALLAPEPALASLRGVLPFGLALSPDGARLFVAESGIDAVGVLHARTGVVLGHVATGWYPSRVAVPAEGQRRGVARALRDDADGGCARERHGDAEPPRAGRALRPLRQLLRRQRRLRRRPPVARGRLREPLGGDGHRRRLRQGRAVEA